jgi:hypothetical protein
MNDADFRLHYRETRVRARDIRERRPAWPTSLTSDCCSLWQAHHASPSTATDPPAASSAVSCRAKRSIAGEGVSIMRTLWFLSEVA